MEEAMRSAITLPGVPVAMSRIGLAIVMLVAGIGIGAGAMAVAQGDDTTQIHACVNNTSGNVRILAANAVCRNNESPIDWNIQGPAGPQGEPGPTGEQGPPGANGEGISAYAHVVVDRDATGKPYVLDAANSNNVLKVIKPTRTSHMRACFDLVFPAHGAVVSVEGSSRVPSAATAQATVNFAPGASCPDGYRDAMVVATNSGNFESFYIVFY
jgi:hypothetical protein